MNPAIPETPVPSDVADTKSSLAHILLSAPVLSVALVCILGASFETSERFRPARIFSSSHAASSEQERPPDAAPVLLVGEAELGADAGTRNVTSKEGTSAHRSGPIGGKEAPLDLPAISAEASPVDLLNPTGHALDAFFSQLAKTQKGEPGALTRIAHFGDSLITSDYVSSTLRQKLQGTFGDAGHGYMLIANAWPAYFHSDVFRFATKGFRVSRIVGPLTDDGLYGLGGVTFRSTSGVIAQFGTAEKGEIGTHVSHFELSYLASPTGGDFEVWLDGKMHSLVRTKADVTEVRRFVLEVEDGSHRFEMRSKGGESRTFGVVLERRVPGVVLDALGIQGARIRFLDKQEDRHFADELKWRNPALVVYQFGANESGDGYAYPMDEFLRTMKDVIRQGQLALPDASCLIIGAMDRARVQDGVTSSMKIIQLIIKEQEQAARDLGCAYFDTYQAMGGWGSMPNWVRRGLGQADMTHPTSVGAMRIGNWIYGALMKEYTTYLAARSKTDP